MRTIVLAACVAALGTVANVGLAEPVSPPKTWSTCVACHTSGSSAIGPNLSGVVGRRAGSLPGFSYSRAMKNAGTVWDETTLANFLTDPQQVVPGNRMPFPGVADPGEVAALIGFLKTLR